MTRLAGIGALTAVGMLAADQASKQWILHGLDLPALGSVAILPVLNLTMVWNRGVTFGLLNGLGDLGGWLLAGVSLLVVAAIARWIWRADRMLVAVALGSIAGGAIGNLVDRLRYGAVVDFIHAHAWGWSWYVFNMADAAIVCGVGALVLDGMFAHPRTEPLAGVPGQR